jgi:hypothetical protein
VITENVKNLTSSIWYSDSLLLSGLPGTTDFVDASQSYLSGFAGTAKFNEDGTGHVGKYPGTWSFNNDETLLTIASDSLPATIQVVVEELTPASLKVTGYCPIKIEEELVITNYRLVYKH